MALKVGDVVSTVAVAAATAVAFGYGPSIVSGTRATIAAVLVLGLTACVTGAQIDGGLRSPYLTAASAAGAFALGAAVLGLVRGSENLLWVTTATMVALWVAATLRHALLPRDREPADATPVAPEREAVP